MGNIEQQWYETISVFSEQMLNKTMPMYRDKMRRQSGQIQNYALMYSFHILLG